MNNRSIMLTIETKSFKKNGEKNEVKFNKKEPD